MSIDPANIIPSKLTECQVAKLTDEYVKKTLETNKIVEGESSELI